MTGGQVSWLFPASSAEPRRPRSFGGPAYFQSCHLKSADDLDTALLTEKMPNVELLTQAEFRQAFTEQHLQARRMALIGTARHLRNQMRCSEASTCEAELRAVTHELLAMGGR